jgi:hypothetical protein
MPESSEVHEPEEETEAAAPLTEVGLGWGDIEIWFVSDERVLIRVSGKPETHNYEELGFADGRNGKPNLSWLILRDLAERGGVIKEPTRPHLKWRHVEKQIQDARRLLKKRFGISSDPLPFVEGTGYRARFKVGCRPSFNS